MKKLEILQELPKYDRETWSEQMLLENDTDRVIQGRLTTNLQFVKKTKERKKERKNQTKKSRNEKGEVTTDNAEM